MKSGPRVGDVAATPYQLAHVSFTEAYAVAERIAGIDVAEIPAAWAAVTSGLLARMAVEVTTTSAPAMLTAP